MSPKKRSAGRNRGFFDSFTCRETICFPAQTRNKTAAPASKTKVDHVSTAPNAKTAKIKRAHRPRTSTHCRAPASQPLRGSRSIESFVSTNAYDDIFNITDPYTISPLASDRRSKAFLESGRPQAGGQSSARLGWCSGRFGIVLVADARD